jgi:hypothetical protein
MKTDDERLKAAEALDAAYAAADKFDAAMLDKWVEEKFERFTKRTDYPKLGWVIGQLNDLGIASIVHGRSFHAPILYVERGKLDQAWTILQGEIDDMDDDDDMFADCADVRPDVDLYDVDQTAELHKAALNRGQP